MSIVDILSHPNRGATACAHPRTHILLHKPLTGCWEITLSHALFVSNLFEASIWARAAGTAVDLEASGAWPAWRAELQEGTTRGLLLGVSVPGLRPAPREASAGAIQLPMPRLEFALGPVRDEGADTLFWGPTVVPGQVRGRRRFYLTPGDNQRAAPAMVTWRVVEAEDRFHLVLFQ